MLLDNKVPVDIVLLLAYWYNHQQVWVRWPNAVPKKFYCKIVHDKVALFPHISVPDILEG